MPPRRLTERQLAILKRRVYSANYRASREYGCKEQIYLDEVLSQFQENPLCSYCGRKLTPGTLSLDHIIPLSAGGLNQMGNIALVCRRDNRFKRDIPAETYKGFLDYLTVGGYIKLFFANYRPNGWRRG